MRFFFLLFVFCACVCLFAFIAFFLRCANGRRREYLLALFFTLCRKPDAASGMHSFFYSSFLLPLRLGMRSYLLFSCIVLSPPFLSCVFCRAALVAQQRKTVAVIGCALQLPSFLSCGFLYACVSLEGVRWKSMKTLLSVAHRFHSVTVCVFLLSSHTLFI